MYITIILCVILLACVASLFNDGLWSNAIRLINVIMAALLAMNYFEPLADALGQVGMPATLSCGISSRFGCLFTVFSIIFKVLTDKLSKVKVKFLKIVDQIGSIGSRLLDRLDDGLLHLDDLAYRAAVARLSPDSPSIPTRRCSSAGARPHMAGLHAKAIAGLLRPFPARAIPISTFSIPKAKFMPNYHFRRAKLRNQEQEERHHFRASDKSDNWWAD